MTERKLASVRRIKEIRPIDGADRIVCAVIDGWELVTQKSNNFQVGDLVVYFEIDSLLPEIEQFEFLRPHYVSKSQNGAGFRLKTIKLRGQVSQGLILPLQDIDGYKFIEDIQGSLVEVQEGQDLTDLLGVRKYEKVIPAQLAGKVRGNFPSHLIPKTDQERIQNCFDNWFYKWREDVFEVTIKLDGSSFTCYKWRDHVGVCSRNLELVDTDDNSFWQIMRKHDLVNKLRALGRNIAIQGELMGPGVQDNREGFTELRMFVFDIFDIDQQMYLSTFERHALIDQLELESVPVIETCAFPGFSSVKDFLRYAERESVNNPVAEGVVFKSITNPNCSFKAISNAYLLKGGD
jgi:RNA ligase (TIGR02306 family)